MIFHKPCQTVTYTCLRRSLAFFYQHKDVAEIQNVLNKKFANACASVHFIEDKTK